MVEQASDFYKKKGFEKVYINTNKEPRRVATLRTSDGKMSSMAYAKYLYTSYWECDIPEGEQVDHINGDRIENLQKISQKYNVIKDRKGQERIECICPVCGQTFLFPKRTFPHIQILAVAEGVVELNLIGKYKYNLVTWQNELCTSPLRKLMPI